MEQVSCAQRDSLERLLSRTTDGVLLLEAENGQVSTLYTTPGVCGTQRVDPSARICDPFAYICADDLPLVRASLLRCAKSGDPMDIIYSLKNGVWNRMFAIRLISADRTEPVLLHAVITDVTDAHPSGTRDALYQKQLEILFSEKQYVTFEADLQTRALSFSDLFCLLYCCNEDTVPQQLDPELPTALIAPESRAEYAAMCRRILGAEPEGVSELSLLGRDGLCYIPAKVIWKNVFDDHGQGVKAVGVIEPLRRADAESRSEEEITALKAQLALQEKYFQRSEQYLRELRRYRHDRKNNIIAVSALINSGDLEGARRYIAAVGARLAQETPLINTENPAIDAILSEKIRQARQLGITVDHMVGLSPDVPIDMQDLCLAVGCCLDNAIEACQRAAAVYPEPLISLRLIEKRGVITFRMKNTSVTEPPPAGAPVRTSKEDRQNHGFGLRNVAAVVEKYHGYQAFTPEPGFFTTSFTLFLNL